MAPRNTTENFGGLERVDQDHATTEHKHRR